MTSQTSPKSATATPTIAPTELPSIPRGRQRSHLFISYSRADRLAVDRLYEDLLRRGYRLWMDVTEHGIETGEDFRRELTGQMSAAEGVIACISSDFLKSPYCKAEIEQAQRENKPIYPVLMRRFSPEDDLNAFKLADVQYTDLVTGEAAYSLGVRRLRNVLPRPPISISRFMQRFGLSLLAVTLLIGLFVAGMVTMTRILYAMLPPPNLSDKDIGIVFAQFVSPDKSVSEADANALAQRFSNLAVQELLPIVTVERLTFGTVGPTKAGPLLSNESPQTLATRYGASIVVYGELVRNAAGYTLTPHFYFDPSRFTTAVNVQEFVGKGRLGNPLTFMSLTDTIHLQQRLSTRVTTLAYIVTGLSKLLAQDYSGARDAFLTASQSSDLTMTTGGQSINTMLGTTYLLLGSQQALKGDLAAALEQVRLAEKQYSEVIASTTEYAQAYNGLAAAKYQEWNLRYQQDSSTGPQTLLDGLAELDQAINAQDQPQQFYQMRAQYVRIQILYALWAYYGQPDLPNGLYDRLLSNLRLAARQIIGQHDNAADKGESLRDITAESYAYLGLVDFGLSNYEAAVPSFRQAAELAVTPDRQMFFTGWLGDCYYELGRTREAINAYREAIKLSQQIEGGVPSIVTHYQQRLGELVGSSAEGLTPSATANG